MILKKRDAIIKRSEAGMSPQLQIFFKSVCVCGYFRLKHYLSCAVERVPFVVYFPGRNNLQVFFRALGEVLVRTAFRRIGPSLTVKY